MHAGFGHHHTTARRAKATNDRVADAKSRVAAIHAGAADVKQRLDTVEAQAWNLRDLAHPSSAGSASRTCTGQQTHDIDQLLDALDVWTAWASGHPVAVADLTNAAEVFADSARQAPAFSETPGEIDRSHWFELLEPIRDLLDQQGVTLLHDTRHLDRAGPDLGLEL